MLSDYPLPPRTYAIKPGLIGPTPWQLGLGDAPDLWCLRREAAPPVVPWTGALLFSLSERSRKAVHRNAADLALLYHRARLPAVNGEVSALSVYEGLPL